MTRSRRFWLAVVAVASAGAAITFLVLWRTEVSARREAAAATPSASSRLSSICDGVKIDFDTIHDELTDETPAGVALRVQRIRKTQARVRDLASVALVCLPSIRDVRAPEFNSFLIGDDVTESNVDVATREVGAWIRWYTIALDASKRAGWPKRAPAGPPFDARRQ